MSARRLFALLLALVLALAPSLVRADDPDEALIQAMNSRLKEIQAKMVQTSDMNERAQLVKQLGQTLEDTLPKLTPQGRAVLEVGIKVLQPIQQEGAGYTKMVADFIASDSCRFTTIKSRAEIKPRLDEIARLAAANQSVINRYTSMTADATRLLDEAKLSDAAKRDFLAGIDESMGRQAGAVVAIRNLDRKLYEQWTAALHLLDARWGAWSVTADQRLQFTDQEAQKKFNDILAEIKTLSERQQHAQEVLANRS